MLRVFSRIHYGRHVLSKVFTLFFLFLAPHFVMADTHNLPEIKVGVLSFGTVNWEMDTIKHHKLDHQQGVNLTAVKVSSKNAAAIALQSDAVDVIMTDMFWVIKQSKDFLIHPTHRLTGGVYTKNPAASLATIEKLGVAGGPNDKNLLVLQAYAQNQGIKLPETVKFAAPPLLNELLVKGQLDGAINFWHYNARLSARGYSNILPTQTMLTSLAINDSVPLLGWVFNQTLVQNSALLIDGFLQASANAKELLMTDNDEWQRLRPLMRAENNQEFESLVTNYRKTFLATPQTQTQQAAAKIFSIIKQLPEQTLFPSSVEFSENIFYFPDQGALSVNAGD